MLWNLVNKVVMDKLNYGACYSTVCYNEFMHNTLSDFVGAKSVVFAIKHTKQEYGPIPNMMAALPNIGSALCSTPQSLADAHYWSTVQ